MEEKKNRISKINIYLFFLTEIVSAITIVLLIGDNACPKEYKHLYLLPIAHMVISFITVVKNNRPNMASIVFYMLYFIRNVITPMVMRFFSYDGMFNYLDGSQIDRGLLVMVYETLIMYIGTLMINPKALYELDEHKDINDSKSRGSIYGTIVLGLFIFFIYGYIRLPELRASYYAIFSQASYYTSDAISNSLNEVYHGSGLNKYIYILCKYIQKYLIFVISVYGLEKLYKAYSRNNKNIYIVLSFLIIPLQFLFMSDANLISFIVAFCVFYALGRIYPSKKKTITKVTIVIGTVSFALIIATRFNTEISTYSRHGMSAFLQAYFPGVCNFGGLFNYTSTDYGQTLLYDIVHGMPFKTTFFGEGDYRLAVAYALQNNARGQIIPCVGQIGHYVGYILAPFFEWIYVYMAKKYYHKAESASDILSIVSYILIFVFASITPVMYNTTIFLANSFVRIIPLLLLMQLRSFKIGKKQIGFGISNG